MALHFTPEELASRRRAALVEYGCAGKRVGVELDAHGYRRDLHERVMKA